jgi:colanic acid/amylovoran biosynthesis glycosyltransferase
LTDHPPDSSAGSPVTVAHLITPYLFQTGTWIHTQLVHARRTRPIVLTWKLEHPESFPFQPIYLLAASGGPGTRLWHALRTRWGNFPPALYRQILAREGARLLHAHLGWEGARAIDVAAAMHLPLVTTFYGRDAGRTPRQFWWQARYRRLFSAGDAFVVEGPNLGRTLEALGCPPERIHVVHLGIDLARISFAPRRPDPAGGIEILVSSSLRPKKGVLAAARAFAALARRFPHARLRILGDGPERHAVEAAVRSAGLGERVTLAGYVAYDEHLAALARAHLFLAASRTAPDGDTEGGAPVALIEAQAAGLPVVSTRHADIPEVVEDGTSGLLSPEYDDDALTANLEWMLTHPDQWETMGRAGRARMEREFNATTQATRLEDIYESLL